MNAPNLLSQIHSDSILTEINADGRREIGMVDENGERVGRTEVFDGSGLEPGEDEDEDEGVSLYEDGWKDEETQRG